MKNAFKVENIWKIFDFKFKFRLNFCKIFKLFRITQTLTFGYYKQNMRNRKSESVFDNICKTREQVLSLSPSHFTAN